MRNTKNFSVGEEVVTTTLELLSGRKHLKIAVVSEVTSDYVALDNGMRFSPTSLESFGGYTKIDKMTPRNMELLKRQYLIESLCKADFSKLSTPLLTKVCQVLGY